MRASLCPGTLNIIFVPSCVQARAIQDMARKLVPALLHPTSLDADRKPTVKSKSSSGSKKAGKKQPVGKSRFDTLGSDYTTGATLATEGDSRAVASERSGSVGADDSEVQAGGWGGVAQGGMHDTGGTWTQEESAGRITYWKTASQHFSCLGASLMEVFGMPCWNQRMDDVCCFRNGAEALVDKGWTEAFIH